MKADSKTYLHRGGFTLVEVLVALAITVMISSAIMVLGSAMSNAFNSSDDDSVEMAKLRKFIVDFEYSVENARLVCSQSENMLILWGTEKIKDGKINPCEIKIFIYYPAERKLKRITIENSGVYSTLPVTIAQIMDANFIAQVKNACVLNEVTILNECYDVSFKSDAAAPWCKFASCGFSLDFKGGRHDFEIGKKLCYNPRYLLKNDGVLVVRNE